MKKNIGLFFLGIFVCAAVVFLYFQISGGEEKTGPVVLIGLDGADWNIMNPLLEEGKLPHLKRLIDGGSSGVLRSFRPTKSPVVWTSIATGKSMVKHGIVDWTFVNKNEIEVPYSASERRVKSFWNILSERELTVGVINWFVTFPPDVVNGFMVSNRFRASVFRYLMNEDVTFPKELKKQIYPHVVRVKDNRYREVIKEEGLRDYIDLSREWKITISEGRLNQVRNFRVYSLQDKSIENISLWLLERQPVDLFATYLRLIDTTSHFGSLFISPELRKKWQEENELYQKPTRETEKLLFAEMTRFIEPVYSYLDNVVGRIVAKSDEKATFVIVSDHGFNFSKVGYNHYNTVEIPHGIIIMSGPDIKKGHRLEEAHVYDVTPTLLYMFDLPVGKDMDGKVLLDAFNKRMVRKKEVRFIPSYEGPHAFRAKTKRSEALDKEELEDLKSLGYIK
jgi:predicted AlkP superfamily phosphohydrolase/phosphomutase